MTMSVLLNLEAHVRQIIVSLWIILCLTFSVSAWASPSDSTLRALEGESVRITVASGQTHECVLLTFDDQLLTIVDSEGNVNELERDEVEKVQLPQTTSTPARSSSDQDVHATASPQTTETPSTHLSEANTVMEQDAREKARADFRREQRTLERTGSAYRISGGILTGVGALTAFSSMLSLGISGAHDLDWRDEKTRDTLRRGAVMTAVVGTAITAAGVTLIVVGNKRRKNARDAYTKAFDISLSPQFSTHGGGAELRLRF